MARTTTYQRCGCFETILKNPTKKNIKKHARDMRNNLKNIGFGDYIFAFINQAEQALLLKSKKVEESLKYVHHCEQFREAIDDIIKKAQATLEKRKNAEPEPLAIEWPNQEEEDTMIGPDVEDSLTNSPPRIEETIEEPIAATSTTLVTPTPSPAPSASIPAQAPKSMFSDLVIESISLHQYREEPRKSGTKVTKFAVSFRDIDWSVEVPIKEIDLVLNKEPILEYIKKISARARKTLLTRETSLLKLLEKK